MIDDKRIKNNYFKFRKVTSSDYDGFLLPAWLKRELSDKNASILDFGCGYGQVLSALHAEGYSNICGADIEESAISFCTKNSLNVRMLDVTNTGNPFEKKFDVIILSHVIEHVEKNLIIDVLNKIRNNFLKEGGQLLIAVPNAQSNTGCYWAYEDWTHTTLFTSGSIYYVLKSAGFEQIDFLDIDCTVGQNHIVSALRKFLLFFFKLNNSFWNKVTKSSFHMPSPVIYSYEIKVKAY